MDAQTQFQELILALQKVHSAPDLHLTQDAPIIHGRLEVGTGLFLNVFLNLDKNKFAFALLQYQQRIWGIDRDNIRGWHRHPLHETEKHEAISPKTISEIITELKQVLEQIEKAGN